MTRVGPHHPRAIALGQAVVHRAIVWSPSLSEPRQIDVHHLGNPLVVCAYELDGVIVDPGPESSHHTLLEALEAPPQRILLTHIHFDHAGATGALVRRWPDVEVWVHERGAPHLIDPSRLTASATRLYGDDMKRLWGEIVAVPQHNLRILTGGERIGPWRVEYTPGHASHHVSYLHEPTGTAFVGDVGGVRVEGGPIIPPTPPPDIDIELWHESLRTVAAWDPARLAVTHFGSYDDVGAHIAAMHDALDRWAALALETDAESYAAAMIAEMERAPDAAATRAFLQAMPPDTLWPGLDRYWAKRNR
jgi:glyoxylase-like metal-dependent hydrolase (beta-lactamase superfamily II)